MSLEEKIKNAKPTPWIFKGIPRWKQWLIVKWARLTIRWRKK